MPIRTGALSAPQQSADDATDEKPKRKRRTKAEIEADKISKAVIPNDDEEISVVFTDGGKTGVVLWPEAVTLAKEGKIDLSEKHQYAIKKLEQMTAEELTAKADAEDAEFDDAPNLPADDDTFDVIVAEAAVTWNWEQIKTHVLDNRNTNLEASPELMAAIEQERAYRAKKAEHGLDKNGELAEPAAAKEPADPGVPTGPVSTASAQYAEKGEVVLGSNGFPLVRISFGYLEKIGLPEYSALNIGPCQVTGYVEDTGEMIEVHTKDGVKLARKAVVEGLRQCGIDAEAAMRAERQSLINFLEAVKGQSSLGGGA